MELINLLNIILVVLVFIILILAGIYVLIYFKNKKIKKEEIEKEAPEKIDTFNGLTKDSIYKFMDFEEIKDNMIVRKNNEQFVMVIHCKGINYDLLSEEEKLSVESGFVQFLNTLSFPIQLYVQTRSVNLKESIEKYKERVDDISAEIKQLQNKARDEKAKGNIEKAQKYEYEVRRKTNVLEYGLDISEYIGRINLNKNVLQQKTYIVVSYFASEFGGMDDYSKEEVANICFSELYTRAQSIIRSISSAGVSGRVLESEELAELLYVAYNRDESETYQLQKALDAQYDALYSTAKDVIKKTEEKIEAEIELDAIELATDSIILADRKRQEKKEEEKRKKAVEEKALEVVEEYREDMDEELYEMTKEQIRDSYIEEKKEIEQQEEKSKKRTRKTNTKS